MNTEGDINFFFFSFHQEISYEKVIMHLHCILLFSSSNRQILSLTAQAGRQGTAEPPRGATENLLGCLLFWICIDISTLNTWSLQDAPGRAAMEIISPAL